MTEPILDANGEPIGAWRDNQDPNFPQRFTEDDDGNRFVDTPPEVVESLVPQENTP